MLAKHATGLCGVGKMLQIWGIWTHSPCPECAQRETVEHVPRCTRREDRWLTFTSSLFEKMSTLDSAPELLPALMATLDALRHGATPPYRQYSTAIQVAMRQQVDIGWRQTVLGKMAIQWSRLQQRHYQRLEHHRTGTWWSSRVAKALLAHYRACWSQRKKALKQEERPGDRRGAIELDRMIYDQLTEGVADLPREHRHHFRLPRRWMLSRDVNWKRTWLNNVLAARARQVRRLHGDDDPLRQQRRQMYNWLFPRQQQPSRNPQGLHHQPITQTQRTQSYSHHSSRSPARDRPMIRDTPSSRQRIPSSRRTISSHRRRRHRR